MGKVSKRGQNSIINEESDTTHDWGMIEGEMRKPNSPGTRSLHTGQRQK
jgi:hypothetical protein